VAVPLLFNAGLKKVLYIILLAPPFATCDVKRACRRTRLYVIFFSILELNVNARVAPNGKLGRKFLPVLVGAVRNEDFAKLNVITTSVTDNVRNSVSNAPEGKIEVFEVSYDNKDSICAALRGVDVLISTMGGYGSGKANDAAQVLIEAGVPNSTTLH
jgi:hypothetical protein